ncbi:MAG: ExbD/TolR family protein [Flavobacteriales bacterium Tduv]
MNLRGKNRINTEFSMSSMTDIVFLLLIFFMLISSMVMSRSIDLILPRFDSSSQMKKNSSSLSGKHQKNGQYYIDQDVAIRRKINRILKEKFQNVTEAQLIIRPNKTSQ